MFTLFQLINESITSNYTTHVIVLQKSVSFSPILIFHLENCGRSGKFHAVTVFFGEKHVEKKHWFYMIKPNSSNKIYVNGPVYVPIIYYILYAFLQIVLCVSVSHYQTLDSCALAKFPATKVPSLGSTKCEIFSFGIKKNRSKPTVLRYIFISLL